MADLKKLLQQYPNEVETFIDQFGNKVDKYGNPISENSDFELDSPEIGAGLAASSAIPSYKKADKTLSAIDRLKEMQASKAAREAVESRAGKSFIDVLQDSPELSKRAEQAALKNPRFGQMLKSGAGAISNPKHTQKFIEALDRMVPEEEFFRMTNPYLAKLKDIKTMLTKGTETAAEAISPYTSGAAKFASKMPGAKMAGKLATKAGKYAGPAGAAYGLYEAKQDLDKGRYMNVAGHGLTTLGGLGMALPHPLAKLTGAGLAGLGTGVLLSSEEEPEMPQQSADKQTRQLLKEKDQEADVILQNLKNEYESDEPQYSVAPSFEYEKIPEISAEPSPTPSPTPAPTPSPKEESISGRIKDKLMDVMGMPSAYAEEMTPATAPIPALDQEKDKIQTLPLKPGTEPKIQNLPLKSGEAPTEITPLAKTPPAPPMASPTPVRTHYAPLLPGMTADIPASTKPSVAAPVMQPSPELSPEPSPEITPEDQVAATPKKKKDKTYYKNYGMAISSKTGLHPAFLPALIQVESSGRMDPTLENPQAGKKVGEGNAVGPVQIMPGTVADFVNRAAKQHYETPGVQNQINKVIDNLTSKINFEPYQRVFNEVRQLERKGIKPSQEQIQTLASLTNDLQQNIKKLSPEEHIEIAAGILKSKATEYGLDAMNPDKPTKSLIPGTRAYETHGQRLIRSYIGIGKNPKALEESYNYLAAVTPHFERERKIYDEFSKIEDELDEKGQPTGRKIRVHSDMALPYGQGLLGDSPEAEEAAKNAEAPPPFGPPITLEDLDNSPDEQTKEYPNNILEILKSSKEEDKQRKIRDLMVLQNYLQGGSIAQMGKGLQLAASGLVGSGPKKPYVTVPELKGIETWDTLGKEGEKGIAAAELMSKFGDKSPSSLASKRMQNYYVSAMRRLHPDKPLSKQDIDIIKSMSKEDLEKELEREKEFAKYETSLFGKNLDRKFKVQKQAQSRSKAVLDPIIQRLQGAKTLDEVVAKVESGELVDSRQISRQITTDLAALLLPPGVRLGVTGQDKAEIDTMNSRIKRLQNFFDSDEIRGTIPKPEYLNQIKQEIDLFRKRYQQLLKDSAEGLKKEFYGLPQDYHNVSDTVVDSRVQQYLDEQYETKPPTSSPVGRIVEAAKEDGGGKYEKIKPGDDNDMTTWRKVE